MANNSQEVGFSEMEARALLKARGVPGSVDQWSAETIQEIMGDIDYERMRSLQAKEERQ